MRYDVAIGIDPGTKTGLVVRDVAEKKYLIIKTTDILTAILDIKDLAEDLNVFVFIEDPTDESATRYWGARNAIHKAQGAGSVKRDFRIWEKFFEDYKIPYYKVAPKDIPRYPEFAVKEISGTKKRVSEHARIAFALALRDPEIYRPDRK